MIFIPGNGSGGAAGPAPLPTPDVWNLPPEELDAIDDLAREIVSVSRRIEADTQRLLALIADFDARRGWELSGHRGCAEWLAASTGTDLGAARERVRTARALAGLPALREAMGRGDLSFSKLRALTRIATPENEDDLLGVALDASAAELERMIRGWRQGTDEEEIDREERRHQSRTLAMFPDPEGMIEIRDRLTPEVGALVMKAIEWASDALYREAVPEPMLSESERRQRAAQRRADALAFLAERAMESGADRAGAEEACGVGTREPIPPAHESPARDPNGRRRPEVTPSSVRSGGLAERYQVLVHVGPGTLAADRSEAHVEARVPAKAPAPADTHAPDHAHRSEVEPGIRVSAEPRSARRRQTSRRLCCDASVVRVAHAPDGSVLDVGRRTRTIPPALRRALEVRDRGCRFPGCHSRFCEAHHIRHWAAGGETSLSNTLLLCRHHHRLVHEGRWTLALGADGQPVFRSPRGEEVMDGRGAPVGIRARGP